MPRTISTSVCLSLVLVGLCLAESVEVLPEADTYVSDTTVNGGLTYMYLNDTANTAAYIRFNLAELGVKQVQSASLVLRSSGNAPRNDNLVNARFVLNGLDNVPGNTPQDWSELELNSATVGAEWRTNNGEPLVNVTVLDDTVPGITESLQRVTANYYDPGAFIITVSGDPLVQFINSRVADDGLVTFVIIFPGSLGRGYGIVSKEHENAEWHPRLQLEATLGPKTAAARPKPSNNATEVPRDTELSWTAGDTAVSHNVYLGTSLEDVTKATVDQPLGVLVSKGQTGTTFDAFGILVFGQTYYWRV
ncbi:MAG: hypothetical protein QHH07_12675, partial [Sedimentisphaerales bacterium]|nr:hypothetical protein [Sedimentisphaerales bacterium]